MGEATTYNAFPDNVPYRKREKSLQEITTGKGRK